MTAAPHAAVAGEAIGAPAHATDADKRFMTCAARAALLGVELRLIEGDDGRPLLIATRWALTRCFEELGEVERWLDKLEQPGRPA